MTEFMPRYTEVTPKYS